MANAFKKKGEPDADGNVEIGDPTGYKGIFVSSTYSLILGKLGNELYSFSLDARSDKEIKEE
tara:strand:- start:233 stop:418 length:186 start_codon:yes stop_codon:yes gene_type:complete